MEGWLQLVHSFEYWHKLATFVTANSELAPLGDRSKKLQNNAGGQATPTALFSYTTDMNINPRRFASLLCFLLLSLVSFSQSTYNVAVSTDNQRLIQFLENGLSTPEATLLEEYPFLSSLEKIQALPAKKPAPKFPKTIDRVFTLTVNHALSLSSLQQSGAFEWVEPNYSRKLHSIKADPPNDDSVSAQWYHSYIRTFEAWDQNRGGEVRVGVIDTGIDYDHPEFEDQLAINSAEDVNGNGRFEPWPADSIRNGLSGDFDGLDNDENGFADDVIGYDFTDQPRSPFGGDFVFADPDPLDDNSHGSYVSGIIAAKANNGFGGSGIAPDCKIVTLRAFSASNAGEDDDIARAIVYAADNGIKLLNFSFGDIYPSRMMQEAIRYAYARGVIMIGSAGNGTGDELHYPSGFPEVISVSASTYNPESGREFLWPLSSYGLTVDLCAPGDGIVAPTLRDTADDGEISYFLRAQGTSAAAPMVTSAAAMLLDQRGTLSPDQVRGLLTTSADDISLSGWDDFTGAGRLNIERALNLAGAAQVRILSPEHDKGSAADSVLVSGTVLDPQFASWSLQYRAGESDTSDWLSIIDAQTKQIFRDTLAHWNTEGLPDNSYTLRLVVNRSDGLTTENRIRFVRDRSAPQIEIKVAQLVWDNELRKFLIIYRSEDRGEHILNIRRLGEPTWTQIPNDRTTRNGEFMLSSANLQDAEYEFFIEGKNEAGLLGQSPIDTFIFEQQTINRSGFTEKSYALPMGRFVADTTDFDQNDFPEVVMSTYDERLSFGPVEIYEFNGGFFVKKDSIETANILIPKDIADTDGDGNLELLVSVNDSTWVLEQGSANSFPNQIRFTDFGRQHFPANFSDTDNDGELELVSKNFRNYLIFEREGDAWRLQDSLEDVSPNYIGSVAPRSFTDDFDGDGNAETVFGDFDGDLLIYEYVDGEYQLSYLNTTDLTKSASYLTAGDFDGDGQQELFVATHTSLLRNSDFEYDPPYWQLRILKAVANDSFEVVWEDYLYDIDTEGFNAATAGNIDLDIADELVFTTFPRTYAIDYENGEYGMRWFFYGAIGTHHFIHDFDRNGIGEIGLGRGDSTKFWEANLSTPGPLTVTSLDGIVLGPDRVYLEWEKSPGATGYGLVFNPLDSAGGPLSSIPDLDEAVVRNLLENEAYFFVMRADDGANASGFGNFIIRIPHENNRVDSVEVVGDRQLALTFSWPVIDRTEDKGYFLLDGEKSPEAIIQAGSGGNRLVLAFGEAFRPGSHSLEIDSLFLDADFGIFAPNHPPINFDYQPENPQRLYLTDWSLEEPVTAFLRFNEPVDEGTITTANFSVSPYGSIRDVASTANPSEVRVTLEGVRLGALGYPLSVTVSPNVCSVLGNCVQKGIGDVATFSDNKDNLNEVFVYPSPVRMNAVIEGLRFANLTRVCTIRVLSASGRFINELQETDGDGGLTWDMRDQSGVRISRGIYLYEVTNEAGERVLGKFTVIE
jgi:subtilisin family serine protease